MSLPPWDLPGNLPPIDAATILREAPPEPAFDRVTKLVSNLLNAPVSLFSLVDDMRSFLKSTYGLAEVRELPLSHALCKHVVESGAELALEDARGHPVHGTNKAVTEFGVVAYLGFPVHGPDGTTLGALCAISQAARVWSARDRDTLATLAKSVETEIALRVTLVRQESMLAELRQAHDAVKASRAIERDLDERTRFFTGLSHEIRTPLNGMIGGLSLLEIADSPERQRELMTMIRASGEALTRFVDDLIDFARDSSERDAAQLAPFDPRTPLEGAAAALAPAVAEKRLVLRRVVGPNVPEHWMSDSKRIETLLVNLGGNAVKFTGEGSITLRLEQVGDDLVYTVSDTGPGISEAYRECIFEPFDRGDPGVSSRTNGSGLGLPIAKRSARLLGARLNLLPHPPGNGAAFEIIVPHG